MLLSYDPKLNSEQEFTDVILGLGYTIESFEGSLQTKTQALAQNLMQQQAPIPENAPAFFTQALARAQKNNQPVLIDFWATWCGPCKRLKNETFADPQVKGLLDQVELIFVDLDKNPELAKAYQIKAVPDVFMLNRQGKIVDRLQKFEAAKPFALRLQRLLNAN